MINKHGVGSWRDVFFVEQGGPTNKWRGYIGQSIERIVQLERYPSCSWGKITKLSQVIVL